MSVSLRVTAVAGPARGLRARVLCACVFASVAGVSGIPLLNGFWGAAVAAAPPAQYSADGISIPAANAGEPTAPLSVRRAAAYLDQGAVAWGMQRNCISCHTNGTYLFIRPQLTRQLGPPDFRVRDFFVRQLGALQEAKPHVLRHSGTRPAQAIYIAAGLAQWDRHITQELSPETDAALRLMFRLQQSTGTWHSVTCWPPFESSSYQLAHMAAIAISSAPGWISGLDPGDALSTRIDLLKSYLRTAPVPHDYARVLQLWTSLQCDGILDRSQTAATLQLIRRHQQPDGGWSIRTFAAPEEWGSGNRATKLRNEPDFDTPASDGHMTGLALIVLQAAKVDGRDPQIMRGLQWLRTNQRQSGRWWTRSLNTDNRHFITYSGTAYPLMALLNAGNSPETD